jgi:hypothetical protein
MYNIVKDYDWTSSPKGSSVRKEAPMVWLKSHKIISNQIMTMIEGYKAIGVTKTAEEFYRKMYSGSTEPEDDFRLPFFGDNVRSFSNTFGDTFQDGLGNGGGIGESLKNNINQYIGLGAQLGANIPGLATTDLSNIKGAATQIKDAVTQGRSAPGSYVETPMFYQFDKNDTALDITFVLSNTINEDSVKLNHELVQKLTEINRPLRLNSISVEPPRIYKVRVYGQRFIQWAYCSQFSVQLLGYRRMINGIIHPEAYQISMSMQSLTMEHAGFFSKSFEGGKKQ